MHGKFHDQAYTKWIVIRGQLWGHNDTPFGWPTPGGRNSCSVVGRPLGVFGGLSYRLVIFFFNIVPLIMEFTSGSQMSQNLDSIWNRVSSGTQSSTILCLAGGHPWTSLRACTRMATCRASLLPTKYFL